MSDDESAARRAPRTIVVTGANRGIGFEVARGLVRAGHHVLVAARTEARATGAVKALQRTETTPDATPVWADLSTLDGVAELAARVRAAAPGPIDSVVHNAAVLLRERTVTADGMETTFQVNHVAPFLLTHLLLDDLSSARAGQVVVVASEAHRRGRLVLDDLHFERRRFRGPAAYSQSKLCNLMFAARAARSWGSQGPHIVAVHPGAVDTELLGALFGPLQALRRLFRSVESGAAPITALADRGAAASSDLPSGSYLRRFTPSQPSTAAQNHALQDRLWDETETLVARSGLL